jgi:hypothetical protein
MLPIDTIFKASEMEARFDRRSSRLHPNRPQTDAQRAHVRHRAAAYATTREVGGAR